MSNLMDDVQLEAPNGEGAVGHHCFSPQHLAEMEQYVRESQAYHQAQAEEMAKYRRAIVQCLANHHTMSYQKIADLLGGLNRSRVQQIMEGKRP